ncbi:MAG: lipopolysaccharide biosynthesis protein [Candidatus Delongbacteria bacterium]
MFRKNLINLIISYLGLAVGLFNTVFKPKVLTSEEIGIFSTIISLTFLIQIFTFGGSLSVLMKFYPKFEKTPEKTKFITSVLAFSYMLLAISILILFGVKNWILTFYNNNSLDSYFFYLTIYLVLSHTIEICERLSRILFVSVKSNIIRNIYFRFLHFTFLLLMYFKSISFGSYMLFFVSLNFLTVIQLVFLSVKNLRINFKFRDIIPDFYFLKQFASYSFFMMISSLSGVVTANLDKIMIGHYLSLSKTGIYSIALAITSTMNIIFDSFARITQPKLSEHLEKENKEDLKNAYYENLYNNIHFGVIAYTLLCVFSHDILSALGKEYSEGSLIIVIIATGLLFNLNAGMCGEVIALSKFYKFDFYSRISLIFIVIASNIILIPIFGITGASVATASNYIFYDLIKIIYAFRKFGLHPITWRSGSFYISGLIIGIVTYLSKELIPSNLGFIAVISVFSFIVYDLILGYIFKYEFSLTKKLIMKYGRNK